MESVLSALLQMFTQNVLLARAKEKIGQDSRLSVRVKLTSCLEVHFFFFLNYGNSFSSG